MRQLFQDKSGLVVVVISVYVTQSYLHVSGGDKEIHFQHSFCPVLTVLSHVFTETPD